MLFSIDRIIAGRAALMGEDGKPLLVPVDMLPPGAKAGDMVLYQNGVFLPAGGAAEERRQRVAEMLGVLLHERDEEA